MMNYNQYRGGNFLSNIPQVTRTLLIINIIIFLVDLLAEKMLGNRIIGNFLAMYTWHSGFFKPYQVVTHMFVHGNFSHLFMNMFGLYMFGRILEQRLESKKFFILYFASGLGAAALQFLIFYLQAEQTAMIGASGAVFGILAAFAVYFPDVPLMLIFFPVPIKAKYFVGIYAVIELTQGVANFQYDNVAHFAHLGGAIVGFILTRLWKQNQFRQY